MKIGIITYHRAINYGAYLQAAALCAKLNEYEDIQAELIDYRTIKEKQFYSINSWKALTRIIKFADYQFHKKLLAAFERGYQDNLFRVSSGKLESDDILEFQKFVVGKYDLIVAGSDEIWKLDGFRGFPNAYWLPGDLGAIKMSYAASSRSNFDKLDSSQLEELRTLLSDYAFVGVRDEATLEAIVQKTDSSVPVTLCCDPSFLYKFHVDKTTPYELLRGKAKISREKKTIIVMTESNIVANKVRKALGDAYNLVSVYTRHNGYINVADLSPREWLNLISVADFVVASYFHAICFSIVNNTPFLATGTRRKSSKLEALLVRNGFQRYYSPNEMENVTIPELRELIASSSKADTDFSAFVDKQRATFMAFEEAIRKHYESIK